MSRLFTASWCKPCQELKSWMKEKGIVLDVIDIDEQPNITKQLKVNKIPTLIANGKTYVGREEIIPYLTKE